jgi:hypothetical protein
MTHGYAGRFLRVNLTEGRCFPFVMEEKELQETGLNDLRKRLYPWLLVF